MAPPTVRHRILLHLMQHPDASAGQIGRALGLAPAAVRHHLRLLRSDGRVTASGARPGRVRGRPAKAYRLSEALRGDNLAMIADILLTGGRDGPRQREGTTSALANGLLEQLGVPEGSASGQRRLAWLVEQLKRLHYEASWEAGDKGPRVLLGHCPYAAIIERHPELCRMDAQALGRALGLQATQTAKLDTKLGGQTHCVFVFT